MDELTGSLFNFLAWLRCVIQADLHAGCDAGKQLLEFLTLCANRQTNKNDHPLCMHTGQECIRTNVSSYALLRGIIIGVARQINCQIWRFRHQGGQ